jgi:hypothetical protein
MMRIFALMGALTAVACSAATNDETALPKTGSGWGGPDVQVTATDHGATIQFVCAHGTIDQLIVPDASGHFSGTGTYVFEHPAAVEGQPNSDSHSARYDAQLSDRTMRITATVPDKQQVVGPFTATLGATGPSTRCQ